MFCGLADEQLVSPFFVEREVHIMPVRDRLVYIGEG